MATRARPSRHLASRGRRITPRRWPALVILPVVLIGAGIVDRNQRHQPRPADRQTTATVTASDVMPTASRQGALSSTWFCAGGTASGDGIAELSVVVINRDATAVPAVITVYDPAGHTASQSVKVPAEGRIKVLASTIEKGKWVAAEVESQGGQVAVDRLVNGPNGLDAGPCSSSSSDRWYFAAGSTVRGADEYLALFNPYPDGASVDISFATTSGERTPRLFQGYQVPGRSVQVVRVTDKVSRRDLVAARVATRSGSIVVDRIQTFDGRGDGAAATAQEVATQAPRGLSVSTGAPAPATRWAFASARKTPGGRNQLVLYNPTGREATVSIAVALDDKQRNGTLSPFQLTLSPGGVDRLDLSAEDTIPDDAGQSIIVRSRVPVVAEDVLTVGKPWKVRGLAITLGSPLAARTWLLPAGGVSTRQAEQLSLFNPGSSTVRVTVRILATGHLVGTPALGAIELAPHGRSQLNLVPLDRPDLSLLVEASAPIVAGRSIFELSNVGIAASLGLPLPETVAPIP